MKQVSEPVLTLVNGVIAGTQSSEVLLLTTTSANGTIAFVNSPAPQITVGGTWLAGDVVSFTVLGASGTYAAGASPTPTSVAAGLTAAINAAAPAFGGTASGPVVSAPLLVLGPAQMADFDCYTITLASGTVLRFTTADFDVSDGGGNTWSSTGVRVDEKRSKVLAHWKTGLDVDTWVVVVMPRPVDPVTGAAFPDRIGNVPWLQAAQGGALDAADFQVDRAVFAGMPTWPMPPGGAVPVGFIYGVFAGVVGEVDTTEIAAVLSVNDYRSLLSVQMPVHFWQGTCRHTLFDAGCTLINSSFAEVGVAGGGTAVNSIVNTLPVPGGSGTYVLGSVVFTSGENAGFSRTITGWSGAGQPLTLLQPFPFAINSGDAFVAYPGCNKTQASCTAFSNLANFGGQPYVPAPETAT